MLGQPLPDRARLLRAQVERQVLGPGQLGPDGRAAFLGDDGQHARDALADRLDLGELVGGAAGDLGDAERGELLLEVLELFFLFCFDTVLVCFVFCFCECRREMGDTERRARALPRSRSVESKGGERVSPVVFQRASRARAREGGERATIERAVVSFSIHAFC